MIQLVGAVELLRVDLMRTQIRMVSGVHVVVGIALHSFLDPLPALTCPHCTLILALELWLVHDLIFILVGLYN